MKTENEKTKPFNLVVMWCFIIAAMTTLVVGQETLPQGSAVMAEQSLSGAPEAATQTETIEEFLSGQTLQTLTFNKEWTIEEALRFLALRYKKNIVPTENVTGRITVTKLYDVTVEEALGAILGANNKYEVQGNFIKVYTSTEYQENRRTEDLVITLY